MTSPWRVLGLTPGCSVDDVRRAYARLLRQHRPDVDPTGFRRVRDAYEVVLRTEEARARGADSGEDDDDDGAWSDEDEHANVLPAPSAATSFPPDAALPDEPPPPRPRELATPLRSALLRARATSRQGAVARLHTILARALRERRNEPELAELAIEELVERDGALRQHLQPADVHAAAGDAGVDLTRALLVAHVVAGDWPALWAAAKAIEDVPAASADPAWQHEVAAAIEVAAMLDPKRAEHLANVAFRRAPAEARNALAETEMWIQAGKQLGTRLLPEARQHLVLALCRPGIGADDPAVERALAIVAESAQPRTLAALLSQRVPAAATRIERQVELAERRSNRRKQDKSARGVGWIVVRAFVVVILMSYVARFCRSPSTEPPRQTKQQQQRFEDALKRFREREQQKKANAQPREDGAEPTGRR